MFNYFDIESAKDFKGVIGQYISRVIRDIKQKESNTIDEVNTLDRVKLAEDFIYKRTYGGKYKIDKHYTGIRDYKECELKKDIAIYIDLCIVRQYWRNFYNKETNNSVLEFPGIRSMEGLYYRYKENYDNEKELVETYKDLANKIESHYIERSVVKTNLKKEILLEMREKGSLKECEFCRSELTIREGQWGFFIGCTRWPECNFTRKIDKEYKNRLKGMRGYMITPKEGWTRFKDENEKIEKLKEIKLLTPTAKECKPFLYKGIYTQNPNECKILGYISNIELVIEIYDNLHTIHPSYLKQMQKCDFNVSNCEEK